ncbi:hypothetical protein D3C76_1058530 [compost metagenome]
MSFAFKEPSILYCVPGPLRIRNESAVTVAFVVLPVALAEVEVVVLVLVLEAIDVSEARDGWELLFTFLR